MTKLADDLRAARGLIDTPEKWAKGPAPWPGNRLCASQALRYMGTKPGKAVSAALPFRWKIRQWLRHRWSMLACTNIIRFNDHPGTTHADIMALFDRAIAQSEVE